MALLEILTRGFEAVVNMPDAALACLIDLPPYLGRFPAIRGQVQLGPWLGPSCETLIQFRLGHKAGGGEVKVFGLCHRS